MRARFRLAVAGVLLVGGGGAAALARTLATPGEIRVAIQRSPRAPEAPKTPESGELCRGGLEPLATVEIVPDVVVNVAGREHVEYHSEILLQRGKNIGVAWKADMIDDRGRVIAKLDAGSFKGQAGNVASTNRLKRPLQDGFYSLRVRAAVVADGEPSDVVETVQRIEVAGGRWIELSESEWLERSSANQAFTAAELAARGLL